MSDKQTKLAKQIQAFLGDHAMPQEATVQEIAAAIGADEADVIAALDSHRVGDDGKVAHAGEGKGGGWVPQGDAAA